MGFYIKNPMARFYIIAGGTLFIFVVMLAALITAQINGDECEFDDCNGEITIVLVGLSDSDPFIITVAFPNGETRIISCSAGGHNEEIPFSQSCSPTGTRFSLPDNKTPPEEVAVTVEIAGQITTRIFTPAYEKEQPNGEDCPPVCYSAALSIDVSP